MFSGKPEQALRITILTQGDAVINRRQSALFLFFRGWKIEKAQLK